MLKRIKLLGHVKHSYRNLNVDNFDKSSLQSSVVVSNILANVSKVAGLPEVIIHEKNV